MKRVTYVPSDTRPDHTYAVILTEDPQSGSVDLVCGCEGYKHRQTCKHTARVAQEQGATCCGQPMTYTPKDTAGAMNTLSCNACEFTIYC